MDAVVNAGGPWWAEDWMRLVWRYAIAPLLLVVLVLVLYVLAYRQGASDCRTESAIAFEGMRSARAAALEAQQGMALALSVAEQAVGPDSPCTREVAHVNAW